MTDITYLTKKLRFALIDANRWIGRQVCRVQEHRYYHPGGLHDTACIYYCIRCNEPNRPEGSLQPIENDPYGDWPDYSQFDDAQEFERARRLISWFPWLKWV